MTSDYLMQSQLFAVHAYDFDHLINELFIKAPDHEPFDRSVEGDKLVDRRLDLLHALRDTYIDQDYVTFYSYHFSDKRYIEGIMGDILEKYLSEMRIRTAFRPLLITDMLRRTRVLRFHFPLTFKDMILPRQRAFEQ